MKQLLEKHFGKAWMALVYLFLYLPLATVKDLVKPS